MAGPMTPYIVKQGDYLAKLAFVKGFDADEVWNDPKNEDLRKLRTDPNILAPGDVLYVPDKAKEALPVQQGTENNYAADVPTQKVTLTLKDERVQNADYTVRGLGAPLTGSTSGGVFSVDVRVPDLAGA